MKETRYTGKFEGCESQSLGERLHEITLDGCCEELGDVQGFGWFAKVDLDGVFYVVSEDNNGFFDYASYPNEAERDDAWSLIEADYSNFYRSEE